MMLFLWAVIIKASVGDFSRFSLYSIATAIHYRCYCEMIITVPTVPFGRGPIECPLCDWTLELWRDSPIAFEFVSE